MHSKIDAYFALTRISQKLPQLEFKTPNEREIQALLKPVESIIFLSDSESGSEESDIPDMFEEQHKSSFLRPYIDDVNKRRKFLSKNEADKRTFDMFTEDFKKVLKDTRDSSKISPSVTTEDVNDINQVLADNKIEPFLKPPGKKIKIVEEPISVQKEEDQDSASTSNSGLWNMIRAHRGKYFRASPPCFNLFEEEEKVEHYLKRPHISWSVMDRSQKKCEEWLNDQND